MKTNYLMPESAHPINNVEQKMTELNVMLFEKFGSFENVFETIQNIYDKLPEDPETEKLMTLILHFRCLEQLAAGSPGFLNFIDERNSYKNGILP
ncbi:MAG: hypothetical protein J6O88_05805 [Chryseobacterium sp.]|uniref:hypothetical protein n=1 Tax=Chryseobacterium sp. TaxID=1871047 RepID=UPI001B15C229|nr:hypothetical protein [Chryseobacterium sp.]MBO6184197.1 hypothetical protein [Chryseobacterium sp.]